MSKNKVYLNDVPLNLFLKYYNSFNKDGMENVPSYEDLKSSAVIKYDDRYDSPIYISKENLNTSGLDAVYFAFGITSLGDEDKTSADPRDVYITTLLSRAAIARIFIALRNNDYNFSQNILAENLSDIVFENTDYLNPISGAEAQVISIRSYYKYVRYEVPISETEKFDNEIIRGDSGVSLKTLSGQTKEISSRLLNELDENENLNSDEFLLITYLNTNMYFKYDAADKKFIIYISSPNATAPKVKNGRYVYKDVNGTETYSDSYSDRFLNHQKAMRRAFNGITDTNGWEYKAPANTISLIQDGNTNKFGFVLKYNEIHRYDLIDANADGAPNSDELLDNLSPSKIPADTSTAKQEVFSRYEKFYLDSIKSLPKYKVFTSGNSLSYGLNRYFEIDNSGFSAIGKKAYCVADVFRRDILLAGVTIGSLENDLTLKTSMGVSLIGSRKAEHTAYRVAQNNTNFNGIRRSTTSPLTKFYNNNGSNLLKGNSFQKSARDIVMARVLGLDTDAPYIALVIYLDDYNIESNISITISKPSEPADINDYKNMVTLLTVSDNNDVKLINTITNEEYESQNVFTSDLIDEKLLPDGYSNALVFKLPVTVSDVNVDQIICGIKNARMTPADETESSDNNLGNFTIKPIDTSVKEETVFLKRFTAKDVYSPYVRPADINAKTGKLLRHNVSFLYAPNKLYYEPISSKNESENESEKEFYFKNVYTIFNFDLYNGLKISSYQKLPNGSTKYYKNPTDPSTIIKESVSYDRINDITEDIIRDEIPDGYNSNEDILFYNSFRNTISLSELIDKFSLKKLYFPDTSLITRGPKVEDNVFYNKRLQAYKDTSKNILGSGIFDNVNLNLEISSSNGYDRIYNLAKGFCSMAVNTLPKEIRKAPTLPQNSQLVNLNNIHYKLVIEDTTYNPAKDTSNGDKYIESGLVAEDMRSIEQRLADATKYPMNFLYEKKLYSDLLNDISVKSGTNDYLTNVGFVSKNKADILKDNMRTIRDNSFKSVSTKIATSLSSAYFNKNIDYITNKYIRITNDIISNIDINIATDQNYEASYKKVYISSSNSFKNKDSNTDINNLLESLMVPDNGKIFKISDIRI